MIKQAGTSHTKRFALLFVSFLLLCSLCVLAQQTKVFSVDLVYDKGALEVTNIYTKPGVPQISTGPYRFEILSFDDSILAEGQFVVPNEILFLPPLSSATEEGLEAYDVSQEEVEEADAFREAHRHGDGHDHDHGSDTSEDTQGTIHGTQGDIVLDKVEFSLRLPYFASAKAIVLYSPLDEKLLTIGTEQFADTCGNGVCDGHESYENCDVDCYSGEEDDFCDSIGDGICDPDCAGEGDPDCVQERLVEKLEEKQESHPIAIIIGLILFVLFLSFVSKRRKTHHGK